MRPPDDGRLEGGRADDRFAGHRNPATTLQYTHLSGRDLAGKLGQGIEHVHAWRRAALADLVGGDA